MASALGGPPVLSTPDERIFQEHLEPASQTLTTCRTALADDEIRTTYEIVRTARELCTGGWNRVALQFPDGMLVDAPRVFESLARELQRPGAEGTPSEVRLDNVASERAAQGLHSDMLRPGLGADDRVSSRLTPKLYILADTSYGACCVDEVAAEHADADVVVHYGRACLSPTSRLPVIYVFTAHSLHKDPLIQAFKDTFPDRHREVILMADVAFAKHVSAIQKILAADGYQAVYPTSIIHDPSSPLPNRTIPPTVASGDDQLKDYHLFHIGEPPASLLLILSSRLASIYIYPTAEGPSPAPQTPLEVSTALALRRRYAVVTSLSTASIFGILVNTLSVKNYLHMVDRVRAQIAAAGKKSYTFVVGKVNAAKLANFGEIGGWVVISCWESSLVDSKDFWRPVITPFELGLALQSDDERVWTGEWNSNFNEILDEEQTINQGEAASRSTLDERTDESTEASIDGDIDSEPESAPPEFDLRTARLVSNSRPMQQRLSSKATMSSHRSDALVKRANGHLARIRGEASPGAEYLRSQRTWQGLGSDFEIAYEDSEREDKQSSAIEQGRSGIARGYTGGDSGVRR